MIRQIISLRLFRFNDSAFSAFQRNPAPDFLQYISERPEITCPGEVSKIAGPPSSQTAWGLGLPRAYIDVASRADTRPLHTLLDELVTDDPPRLSIWRNRAFGLACSNAIPTRLSAL